MAFAIEFLLRLLDHSSLGIVDREDLQGRHATLLAACQTAGFLAVLPTRHPAPTCPYCGEGVAESGCGRDVCSACFAGVDEHRFRCWELDLAAFLRWLAGQLHLMADVCPVEMGLWQLGSHEGPDGPCACFFGRGTSLSAAGRNRLAAYRSAVLLYGLRAPPGAEALAVTTVSLLSVLGLGDSLWAQAGWLPGASAPVRFDLRTGRLDAGGLWYGEVPAGSREHAFLTCLAAHQGQFVGYAEIKREVLRATGGRDTRDAASFCHRLKSRLKKRYAPRIDSLLRASKRGDGYRLLARKES